MFDSFRSQSHSAAASMATINQVNITESLSLSPLFLAHSVTHSLPPSLTLSLTSSLLHSLTHSLIHVHSILTPATPSSLNHSFYTVHVHAHHCVLYAHVLYMYMCVSVQVGPVRTTQSRVEDLTAPRATYEHKYNSK